MPDSSKSSFWLPILQRILRKTFSTLAPIPTTAFANKVAHAVANGDAEYGVLVCGTGIGMALTADKVAGIRASSITTPEFAALFREHNDGNVVCLSGRFVDLDVNKQIIKTFLATEFGGGRHQQRVDKIMANDNR